MEFKKARKEMVQSIDYISEVDDCLLGKILSSLPFDEAVRSSILSRRWRYTWKSIYLIQIPSSPIIQKMRRCSSPPEPWFNYNFSLNLTIQSLLPGIQEFTATYLSCFQPQILECKYLTLLDLSQCEVPDGSFNLSSTYTLRTLKLNNVYMLKEDLFSLISNCPLLESLSIHKTSRDYSPELCLEMKTSHLKFVELMEMNVQGIIMDASNLTDMTLVPLEVERIWGVTVNAPLLERFQLGDFEDGWRERKLFIDKIPRMRNLLSGFQSLTTLKLDLRMIHCRSFNEAANLRSSTLILPKLTTLFIRLNFKKICQISVLGELLEHCPCVRELNIQNIISKSNPPVVGHKYFWEEGEHFSCLEHHLRSVNFQGFSGSEPELGLVEFLAKNSHKLQKMTVDCCKREARVKLLSLQTAYLDAKIFIIPTQS